MEIPARIEGAVSDAVAEHLGTELGNRGLLLQADALAAAEAEATEDGARLLNAAIQRCYPVSREDGRALEVEFGSERVAARLAAALAFGAVTARVLAPDGVGEELELLCATFNLGIGLVDGVCDDDAATGGALLDLVQGQDLAKAAEEPRDRGWLRATLPTTLADDYTVAFTVDIIETFFETLHDVYPDDAWSQQRRGIGTQLGAALQAERQSVVGSAAGATHELLIESSRLTSVLPFQIIEALAGGDRAPAEPTPGMLIGEAMWLVDDLVDLCEDARSGALNAVLLAATEEVGDPVAALERLLDSTELSSLAARASEKLDAGLRLAGAGRTDAPDQLPRRSFLYFIQRYAGIVPRQLS